jgi:hypothetical protein
MHLLLLDHLLLRVDVSDDCHHRKLNHTAGHLQCQCMAFVDFTRMDSPMEGD